MSSGVLVRPTGTAANGARQIEVRPLARPESHRTQNGSPEAGARAAVLTLVPAPPARGNARGTTVTQQQQLLDLEFASPTPFVPVIVPDLTRPSPTSRPPATWDEEDREDSFFEPQPTGRADLPEPAQWARRYGQAWVEASLGRRPVKQLTKWSSPSVLADLERPTNVQPQRAGAQPTATGAKRTLATAVISGVRVDEPADGVAEVAAVIRSRGRCRALMLRLEGWDGRWVCTYAAIV